MKQAGMTKVGSKPQASATKRPQDRARLALTTLATVSAMAGPAAALDIKTIEGGDAATTNIALSGAVVAGDSLKVRGFMAALPAGKPIRAELTLDGGDRREAMAIGRYLYQVKVRMVVPGGGARCGSPCPLVLVAGRDPVTEKPSYIKHSTGSVAFNGVRLNYAEKEYTTKDLDSAVAGAQQETLAIADYLRAVGANIGILSYYVSVRPGAAARMLTNEEALDLGIAVIDDATKQLIPPTPKAR